MKRRIGVFFVAAVLTVAVMSQVAEEFRPTLWGLYFIGMCVGVGFIAAMLLGGGKKQTKLVAAPLTRNADRLRSFLATFYDESFTEAELRARRSLRDVDLTSAITELGDRIHKGNRAGSTTYKLKQL